MVVDLKIGVVGAGIIGITTALQLKNDQFRNADVDIIADSFGVTSLAAAGIFRPGSGFSGIDDVTTRKWIDDSWYYWDNLRRREEGPKAGVIEISGYCFSDEFPHVVRNEYLEKLSPLYRPATEEELKICPGNWKYGSFFVTLLTDPSRYMDWAMNEFKTLGGQFVQQKINTFFNLSKKYDILVNCTGIGSRTLCEDKKLVPIRGQVLKVEAPWIKTFFYGNFDTYIIPSFNSVTLGGCRQYDSYDFSSKKYDTLAIREQCENLVPALKGAPTLDVCVGLRPYRPTVRVEKEILYSPNGQRQKIVHNYGHGGYGVTTAPGTAMHAVELVRQTLVGNTKL